MNHKGEANSQKKGPSTQDAMEKENVRIRFTTFTVKEDQRNGIWGMVVHSGMNSFDRSEEFRYRTGKNESECNVDKIGRKREILCQN